MTDQLTPEAPTTVPPPPVDGAVRTPSAPVPEAPTRPARTRTGSVRIALIAGTLALIAVLIFIIQNTSGVSVNFLGAHLHVSLAVAMLLAAIAGALVLAAAGTARITQLRKDIRRERRKSRDR